MRHHRQRVRRLREPSFRAPVDRTSDPQTPLTRHKFSGKQLIVKSPDPNEHWKVAWEHY